jgi:hypothetical protein
VVEHLITLRCLGPPPENAMIALKALLYKIGPHGWARWSLLGADCTGPGLC